MAESSQVPIAVPAGIAAGDEGSGTVSEITSSTLTITNPAGPTVDLEGAPLNQAWQALVSGSSSQGALVTQGGAVYSRTGVVGPALSTFAAEVAAGYWTPVSGVASLAGGGSSALATVADVLGQPVTVPNAQPAGYASQVYGTQTAPFVNGFDNPNMAALVAAAQVAPGSAGVVAELVSYLVASGFNLGIVQDSIAVVPANQPLVAVTGNVGNTGGLAPIPSQLESLSTGSDTITSLFQPGSDTSWEFWALHYNSGAWSCGNAGVIHNCTDAPGTWANGEGGGAGAISYAGLRITQADLASSVIAHPLGLLMSYVSSAGEDLQFWPPASAHDSGITDTAGAPAMGMWFRLPSSVAMPGGMAPLAQMVFTALQTYGCVVIDSAGGAYFAVESNNSYTANGGTGTSPLTTALAGDPSYNVLATIGSTCFPQLQQIIPPSLGYPAQVYPTEPLGIEVAQSGTTSLIVSWAPPLAVPGGVLMYEVAYRPTGQTTWSKVAPAPTTTTATITGLLQATLYDIQVSVVSANGATAGSYPVAIATGTGTLTSAPIVQALTGGSALPLPTVANSTFSSAHNMASVGIPSWVVQGMTLVVMIVGCVDSGNSGGAASIFSAATLAGFTIVVEQSKGTSTDGCVAFQKVASSTDATNAGTGTWALAGYVNTAGIDIACTVVGVWGSYNSAAVGFYGDASSNAFTFPAAGGSLVLAFLEGQYGTAPTITSTGWTEITSQSVKDSGATNGVAQGVASAVSSGTSVAGTYHFAFGNFVGGYIVLAPQPVTSVNGETGAVIVAATVPASGVTAGSYTNTNLTVGADGRLTAASSGGGAGGGVSILAHAGAPTSGDGTFTAGSQALDTQDILYVCIVSGTPGTWVAPPGQVLAALSYNPAGNNSYTTTSTSLVAIDATNLVLAFTAPPSGKVWVESNQYAAESLTYEVTMGLLSASAQVGPLATMIAASASIRSTAHLLVSGLTPGTSYTFQLAWQVKGGTGSILYGSGTNNYGPVTMKVITG